MNTQIRELVNEFVASIQRLALRHVESELPLDAGLIIGSPAVAAAKRRYVRRAPHRPQLCPVPRCRQRAAPAFEMVCAKHADVPKWQIAKYREARRARKAGR